MICKFAIPHSNRFLSSPKDLSNSTDGTIVRSGQKRIDFAILDQNINKNKNNLMLESPKSLLRAVWANIISNLRSRQSKILFHDHFVLHSISEEIIECQTYDRILLVEAEKRKAELIEAVHLTGYLANQVRFFLCCNASSFALS